MTTKPWFPFLPYALVGVLHLVALFTGATAISTPTKWLLMPALLLAFLWGLGRQGLRRPTGEVALLGALAIVFSWLGDILIAQPGDLGFLAGLGAFFLAHVTYLLLFLRPLRRRRIPLLALVFVGWWVALLIVLGPSLGPLFVPVAIYGLVLGAAAGASFATSRTVAVGAVLFLCSDTLLAFKMFYPGFALWQADFLIMVLYVAGQGLIAYGAVKMRRSAFPTR